MISNEAIVSLHAHPNVVAFREVLAFGESTMGSGIAYHVLYGWHPRKAPNNLFTSFEDHPRIYFNLPNGQRTSAAGKYQITARSWDHMRERRPGFYINFTPYMQDLWVIDRLDYRRALDPLLEGDLFDCMKRCRSEWSSLPDGVDPKYTVAKALSIFRQHGGRA